MSDSALRDLAAQAQACTRCDLYRHATQAVFGEGPADAAIMLVGEQPGDREDITGRPFVGPAGRLLDEALAAAGIERASVYVTNAVKHFKHEPRGRIRLHKTPTRDEAAACRWWLDQELALVAPSLVVALGVTAARTLLGRPVTLSRERGQPVTIAGNRAGLVTIHPSAILRMPGEAARTAGFDWLVADLRTAAALVQAA